MKFDYEITKREVLFSIIIISIMLILGLVINSNLKDYELDKNSKYEKAISIEDKEVFDYCMSTNVGNAFIYGNIKAIDTIEYENLKTKDKYLHLKKITKKYTMHTRRVAHRSGKHTYYTTETYWRWDTIDTDSKTAKEVEFLGNKFKTSNIDNIINDDYIREVKTGYHLKEVYYGTKANQKGTIFANLKNNTINNAIFYGNTNIKNCRESLITDSLCFVFWFFWLILTGIGVYAFYIIDNKWLE